MGLSKQQMQQLVINIQNVLDNPVLTIEWKKITQEFSNLLDYDIEYSDEEIEYVLKKLEFDSSCYRNDIYVIANNLLLHYSVNKNIVDGMADFEKNNKPIIDSLNETLPIINKQSLSYGLDHCLLMNCFEKLVKQGIEYNVDQLNDWLCFKQDEFRLRDSVIAEIVKIAEFIQLYLRKF
ncbi:MAG: hypothetical protein J4F36_07745 [Nitrosopumilaceae archaeon]|nr:hypothetical protein [Nitrosopumilaceae archaeon]